jgi:aspartokinase/homoserine dehydrogenase 1
MKVMKFGGSSVGNAEIIAKVISIVQRSINENRDIIVVVSAFKGVTNSLIQLSEMASQGVKKYKTLTKEIENRHFDIIDKLISPENQKRTRTAVGEWLNDLKDVLHGLYLVRELSPRTLDFVMSFGERLSAFIVSEALLDQGESCEFLDSRKLIKTDEQFGSAKVDFSKTNRYIRKYFKMHRLPQIVTGFIGSTSRNETTTLGRSGSDYTASIFGAALDADVIEIWTDVAGVMTADPRKVEKAFTISRLSYEEAMELSHFGAKVIHPSTMQPALDKKIPIHLRNTFSPSAPGTIIHHKSNSNQYTIKGISSIDDIALINVQGSGMVGVAGVARRIFTTLAEQRVNVILITQASSEHSVCFAVLPVDAEKAAKALKHEFRYEIRDKMISEIEVQKQLTILAIVGEKMRQTPGVSGKTFQALGKRGINVAAIAQGSSELNISVVVSNRDQIKALNALHETFFDTDKKRRFYLYLVGTGKIGSALLQLIQKQDHYFREETSVEFILAGLINKQKMFIENNGIPFDDWLGKLTDSGKAPDLSEFISEMKKMKMNNRIMIDCTASKEITDLYPEILEAGISVVTPNKLANARDYTFYTKIRNAARGNSSEFFYETNVGAGLPVISTIRDLINSGDTITKIEGVLSGTISFIFNSLTAENSFSTMVKKAMEKGYTEPDPREDLNAGDIARKLLILARECGLAMELKDIQVEQLIPSQILSSPNIDDFIIELKKLDNVFETKRKNAEQKGKVLRYIANLENGHGEIVFIEVDREHPFYYLSGSDNIISIYTKYYQDSPIVIRGPGAGVEVTTAGVLADIIKAAKMAFY